MRFHPIIAMYFYGLIEYDEYVRRLEDEERYQDSISDDDGSHRRRIDGAGDRSEYIRRLKISNDDNEFYQSTPEESARIQRAIDVWEEWKDVVVKGSEFTKIQESIILNMLFRMQEAEHAHFCIDIPKAKKHLEAPDE